MKAVKQQRQTLLVALALLVVFLTILFIFSLNRQYTQQEQLNKLQTEQQQNKQFTDALLTEHEHLQVITGVINHYKTQVITLKGTNDKPENSFQLHVNPTKKQAVLLVRTQTFITINLLRESGDIQYINLRKYALEGLR